MNILKNISEKVKSFFSNDDDGMTGLFGTIIFHLILAIIFMAFQVRKVSDKIQKEMIVIDFTEKEYNVEKEIEKKEKIKKEYIDQVVSQEMEPAKNIPVNVAKKIDEELNPDKYLKEFKDELGVKDPEIKEEELGDINVMEEKEIEEKDKEKKEYKGPTTVNYYLKNRSARHLPIPVYMCPDRGKVVVDIKVDQEGYVVQTSINGEKTEVQDDCLFDVALKYARRARFNIKQSAPARQEGYISYVFQEQEF